MKISRLVSIIIILLERERVNAQELAAMFEVSMRTIYRDIDAINLAGIPIVSTPGVKGGFEIMKNYKLEKNFFSTADITTILTGLSGLSNLIENEELLNAIIKMRSFIPYEKLEEINFKTDQIHIDLSHWNAYRNLQPYLKTIQSALSERKILSFDYLDRHGNNTQRRVEPYQIVLKGNHWYFQSYCYMRNDFRLFKLARLSNLKIEKSNFLPRDYQKPVLEFFDVLETIQINIKLRVHRSILDRVLEFCSYENCLAVDNDYFIVDFPFIENDYYYHFLLGFGNKCECLEPIEVRRTLAQKIDEIASLYRK